MYTSQLRKLGSLGLDIAAREVAHVAHRSGYVRHDGAIAQRSNRSTMKNGKKRFRTAGGLRSCAIRSAATQTARPNIPAARPPRAGTTTTVTQGLRA
jgi:hypothetical protein